MEERGGDNSRATGRLVLVGVPRSHQVRTEAALAPVRAIRSSKLRN